MSLSHPVDFDDAVDALMPYINSDMSITACTAACKTAAVTVLGPAAALSGVVCTPLCEGYVILYVCTVYTFCG